MGLLFHTAGEKLQVLSSGKLFSVSLVQRTEICEALAQTLCTKQSTGIGWYIHTQYHSDITTHMHLVDIRMYTIILDL